jgi:putative FmdB family regulatory protein
MPLYEYQCDACTRLFELIRKFSDPPLETCPHCGGSVRKLFSSPAIQFKGSGFYITDYAKKDQTTESPSSDSQPEPVSKDKDTGEKSGAREKSGEKVDKTQKSEKSEKSEKRDKTEKAGKDDKAGAKPDAAPASPSKTPPAKDGT